MNLFGGMKAAVLKGFGGPENIQLQSNVNIIFSFSF